MCRDIIQAYIDGQRGKDMELVDIYNTNRERTGKTLPRKGVFDCLADNERILLVHACVFNSGSRMLIQQRQTTKDLYPGCWDVSAGGFVSSGEDSADAAMRETSEELGLDLSKDSFSFVCCEPFGKVLDDFYNVYADTDIPELRFQVPEVLGAAWAGREEVLQMVKGKRFVDYSTELINRLFDTAESR